MNLKKRIMSVMLASLMALTFVGCGGSTDTTTATGGATTETTTSGDAGAGADAGATTTTSNGEYLNVMIEVEVASLDPQLTVDGTSFEAVANFTDGLLQMGPNSETIPAIAKTVDVSEDGLTYTFNLRDDAVWSNGTPVTADDFVFGWQRAVDPELASEYSYMLSDIGQVANAAEIISGSADKETLGITAVDDYTLQVDLVVPVSYFESLMYFPTFYPVNRAFFEEVGQDAFGTSPSTTLSNGAFILETYEPASLSFELKKNETYWDADRVSLPGLSYQVVKDSQQAFMSYQSGDLDIVTLTGDQIDQVEGDPELEIIGAGYLWFLTLNMAENEYLDNTNLRLAITNAVNRDSLTNDVLKDGSMPAYTAVAPKFAVSSTGEDFSANQARYSDICSHNPEKALEYLEAAKAELGVDTFTFDLLLEDSTETQNVAAVLKEQLESTLPGTTFNLIVSPKKQRVEDIQNGNYEVCLTRWGPDYADPMTYLGMWVTGNENNYGNWSSEEFDQLVDACTTGEYSLDADARWEAMREAEALVMEDAVITPLYAKSNANMIKSNVEGVEFHAVALNRVYKNATKS